MLRFIHAADLHLDHAFATQAVADPALNKLLQQSTFRAFDRLIDYGLREQVDFLLIAGDVFDSATRSLKAQLAFRDGLARLAEAGIPSFICHGNHDPLSGWSKHLALPEKVHIFGPEVRTVPVVKDGREIALIHGVSFAEAVEKRNLAKLFRRASRALPQIGLLHGLVGGEAGHEPYAPCTLADLEATALDYWALGHVHHGKVLRRESPTVAYPGSLQGLHIRECDDNGALLVTLDGTESTACHLTAQPLSPVRWRQEKVNLDEIKGEDELLRRLEQTLQALAESLEGSTPAVQLVLLRLTLSGRSELASRLDDEVWRSDLLDSLRETGLALSPPVLPEGLRNETRPAVDLEVLRNAGDFLGDCLTHFADLPGESSLQDELALALRPLVQSSQGRKLLADRPELTPSALAAAAQKRCLDLLLEDDA